MKECVLAIMDEWDSEFETIVNRFIEVFRVLEGIPMIPVHAPYAFLMGQRDVFLKTSVPWYHFKGEIHLVEADEDEDFTYGALIAALAHYHIADLEHEWLLTKQYGRYYTLQHTDFVLTNDEDGEYDER